MAGNQLGKTLAGGFEVAMHATGLYPSWWTGKRFTAPIRAWVAGVTGESTRDNPQRILLGNAGAYGTGTIPRALLPQPPTASRGVAGLADMVRVTHVSGGESSIGFKSYERGREKWQGETLHFVWFDEEPPLDIYTEGLTRTNVTGGGTIITFTPLLGMSDTVLRFIGAGEPTPGTHVTQMTIEDALHYTAAQRAAIISAYPLHEREARAHGVPILGSGRVFPIGEDAIRVDPIRIPDIWPQIGALDFGWDHPTAAVRLCWDRDADCVYVTHTHRLREATPLIHAATLQAWGDWMPCSWPHDGLQHSKDSGEQLATQYRKQGLKMLGERATFADGSSGVEAGLMEMLERMQTGRLKVFNTLGDWFEEFRLYHRKDGLVMKDRDDLMSATRYGLMMLRHAKTRPERFRGTGRPQLTGSNGWMGA